MSNTIIYVDQRFEVKNSGISCLTLIFNLSNPRMTILLKTNGFKFARYDESCIVFFGSSKRIHGSAVKANSSVLGKMDSILAR